ncbi:hypothetical protein M0813_08353 [Anaeramoeba flamelloides]|uniref:WD40 repeat-like protein n=1 Tax=Anaeramoeba flamelloides TaxID=1746091 RepID=A0ABQ8XB81_9EUKA|nr:hypothetical protein M0813_08353 [Anaeramoeba flamelloides]
MNKKTFQYCDKLVQEYLQFRGFNKTVSLLSNEHQKQKNPDLLIENLVQDLFNFIALSKLKSFLGLWNHISKHYFGIHQIEHSKTIKELENFLLKHFLITAIENNRREKINEFFVTLSDQLTNQTDWKHWFSKSEEREKKSIIYMNESAENEIISLKNEIEFLEMQVDKLKKKIKSKDKLIENIQKKQDQSSNEKNNSNEVNSINSNNNTNENNANNGGSGSNNNNSNGSKETTQLNTKININKNPNQIQIKKQTEKLKNVNDSTNGDIMNLINNEDYDFNNISELEEFFGIRNTSNQITGCLFQDEYEYQKFPAKIRKSTISKNGLLSSVISSDGNLGMFTFDGKKKSKGKGKGKGKGKTKKKKASIIESDADLRSISIGGKDGNIISCGTNDKKIKLYDIKTKKILGDLNITSKFPIVEEILYDTNGDNLVVATSTELEKNMGSLFVLNMEKLKKSLVYQIEPSNVAITAMNFSSDSNLLLTGGTDGMIRIFEKNTKLPIMGWLGHNSPIRSICFSPNNKIILSASEDGSISLWSYQSLGKSLLEYQVTDFPNNLNYSQICCNFGTNSEFLYSCGSTQVSVYNVFKENRIDYIEFPQPIITSHWSLQSKYAVFGSLEKILYSKYIEIN